MHIFSICYFSMFILNTKNYICIGKYKVIYLLSYTSEYYYSP